MRLEVIKPPKEEKKELSIDNFVKDLREGIESRLLNPEELYLDQQKRKERLEIKLINYISQEISCFGKISGLDIKATNKLRDVGTGIVPEYIDSYEKLCENKNLDGTKEYNLILGIPIFVAQLAYRGVTRYLLVTDKIGRGASFQARREYREKTDELLGRLKQTYNELPNYAQNAKT